MCTGNSPSSTTVPLGCYATKLSGIRVPPSLGNRGAGAAGPRPGSPAGGRARGTATGCCPSSTGAPGCRGAAGPRPPPSCGRAPGPPPIGERGAGAPQAPGHDKGPPVQRGECHINRYRVTLTRPLPAGGSAQTSLHRQPLRYQAVAMITTS
jgi:hypothetical protein